MRPAERRLQVDRPGQRGLGGIGDVERRRLPTGVAVADVQALGGLVHDRVVGVLALVPGFAVLEPGQPGAPDEARRLRVLQIEDLHHHVAEARLARRRVEVAGLARPPALVRAQDERAAAPGPARVGRCAGDLRHQRNGRRVGGAIGDVEDLVLQILAGLAFGQDLRVADQVVAPRAVERVVVDHRHASRVAIAVVRDVPDQLGIGRVGDVEDRGAVPLHLAGDGVQLRFLVPEALVVADVDPRAVALVGQRRHHQRLAALKIVIADQLDAARLVGVRVGAASRRATAVRRSSGPAPSGKPSLPMRRPPLMQSAPPGDDSCP